MIRLLALLLTAGLLLAPLGAVAGWAPSDRAAAAAEPAADHDGCDRGAPAAQRDGDCCTSGGHCLGLALRPAVATGSPGNLPTGSRAPGIEARRPGLAGCVEPPPPRT